jgi:hypothetical protein
MLDISSNTTTPATTNTTPASYSETELCALWGKSPKTLYDRRKLNNMPAHYRNGIEVRYLAADVEAYVFIDHRLSANLRPRGKRKPKSQV